MELTASTCNTKESKRLMRRAISAPKQRLMGSDFGVLWVGDVLMYYEEVLSHIV